MLHYEDTLSSAKDNFGVLILGSYSDPCFDKLHILKSELNQCGFKNASLVSDFADNAELAQLQFDNYPLYTYRKSVYWIERSQSNLFIFFNECPFGSVISEMIISVLKFDQFKCSTFFFDEQMNFDSVPRGFMSEYDLNIRYFQDLEDLIQKAKRECRDHIIDKCHEHINFKI